MQRYFNVSGDCNPKYHYMVDLTERLEKIKKMIDRGFYFTINRARQFGKTTTLKALKVYLEKDYKVISLDFQMLSYGDFESEKAFVSGFSRELLATSYYNETIPDEILKQLKEFSEGTARKDNLGSLFLCLSLWCKLESKPIVLMIDEIDSATNNQVFLDFLAQLRGYYIQRYERPTFQSVILAGVYDVKNLRRKLRPEDEHRVNSPWNIAVDFDVDMSLSRDGIEGMLREYEEDYHTGMDIDEIAGMLYDYTSGYPFLVSRLCQLIDEEICEKINGKVKNSGWTKSGFYQALRMVLTEKHTLFESLTGKLQSYPELSDMIQSLLFAGKSIVYNIYEPAINIATMFGFVKNQNGVLAVANRIFDTWLYNLYLSTARMQGMDIYKASLEDKNQFIVAGHLNMKLILEKFVEHFNDLYGDSTERFIEEEGRKYFLLYLRPIINGTGNYYIESRTRNLKRTDVIVDYRGEQYIIEMKIWHGDEYKNRGEKQLAGYLEDYHVNKGYMISFNFNKNKKIGVQEISIEDKTLIEAIV